jgi:hypothetical protein
MGLTFHYKGSISSYHLIDEMIGEVEDISKTLGWKYHIWGNDKSIHNKITDTSSINYKIEDLKGISISPDECEPLSLTFLPDGKLCCPIKLIYNDTVTADLMIDYIHTKTQFAGPDTHIALLKLLRYLKNKYFTDLKVDDEGMYWETQDENVLRSQFAKYNMLLNSVTDALSDFKREPGESVTSLADRLEEMLLKKFSDGNN